MANYWLRVFRRSLTETTSGNQHWKAYLGWGSFGAFIIGSLIFWYFQGLSKAAEQWLVWSIYTFGAGVCLFLAALVLNFLRTPGIMEREVLAKAQDQIDSLKERVCELEDKRQQLLSFDFRPEDNKFRELSG